MKKTCPLFKMLAPKPNCSTICASTSRSAERLMTIRPSTLHGKQSPSSNDSFLPRILNSTYALHLSIYIVYREKWEVHWCDTDQYEVFLLMRSLQYCKSRHDRLCWWRVREAHPNVLGIADMACWWTGEMVRTLNQANWKSRNRKWSGKFRSSPRP